MRGRVAKRLLFEKLHLHAVLCQNLRRLASCKTAADDRCFHICSFQPETAGIYPAVQPASCIPEISPLLPWTGLPPSDNRIPDWNSGSVRPVLPFAAGFCRTAGRPHSGQEPGISTAMRLVLRHSGKPGQARNFPYRPVLMTMFRPHFSQMISVTSSGIFMWTSFISSSAFSIVLAKSP